MYEYLEECGLLSIRYKGKELDSYTFGIFHLNLHEIIQKVALDLLVRREIIGAPYVEFDYRFRSIDFPRHLRRVIRAEVSEIKVGSLSETIKFFVIATLADPDARSVLQGFVGNLLFAISSSGLKGITSNLRDRHTKYNAISNDPLDIGPNLRDMMIALAENNMGHGIELTFKNMDNQVTIRIPTQNQDHYE
jgi:hypothetical protein